MKKQLLAMAAPAVLLICALSGGTLATGPDLRTEVSIRFQESIRFERMLGSGGMDIDFGVQPMPLTSEHNYIPAPDGSHTLRVSDGRLQAGGWYVDAQATPFLGGSEDFRLFLYRPACTPGLAPNLTGGDPKYVSVYSHITNRVMTAATGLSQGNYDLTCAAEDTQLYIDANWAVGYQPQAYTSTVTWTLNAGHAAVMTRGRRETDFREQERK